MIIKQLSIFLENKSGRIYDIASMLGEKNINIRALSLADAADFGIMRLIVDELNKAVACLDANNISFKITSVIAVEVPDCPGGLAQVMEKFAASNVNIEYMYSIPGRCANCATMIIRTDNVVEAIKTLQAAGLNILKQNEIQA
jgi:hypothetical protein